MFVYLLIAAELGVLYTVFWYLYVREPHVNRRITGNLWGSYDGVSDTDDVDALLTLNGVHPLEQATSDQHQDCCQQYVLDHANHYVRPQQARNLLQRFAATVDQKFSGLNVRH